MAEEHNQEPLANPEAAAMAQFQIQKLYTKDVSFELPNAPDMGRDENTPAWVQHIAFELESEAALLAAKAEIEAHGVDVLGPVHHGIFRSIYLFDPNGHRLELAANIDQPGDLERLREVAREMVDEWAETKRAPRHAAWLHEREFGGES